MEKRCENCSNWTRTSGTKRDKSIRGHCKFLKSRIQHNYLDDEPEKSKKNNSLVIFNNSQISGEINGLTISSNSKEWIVSFIHLWTDAGFYCAQQNNK